MPWWRWNNYRWSAMKINGSLFPLPGYASYYKNSVASCYIICHRCYHHHATRVLSSVSLLLHAHVKINFIAAPQLWNTIFLQLFPENNWLIINKTRLKRLTLDNKWILYHIFRSHDHDQFYIFSNVKLSLGFFSIVLNCFEPKLPLLTNIEKD